MIQPLTPDNEEERLKNIKLYAILDTLPEEEYDDITRLASLICQTPISLITILDEKRQWFKSRHGIDSMETPREYAFCSHAILKPDEVLMVEDARKDDRFRDNPFVTGSPNGVFYAGVPLISTEGFAWGTLCVMDKNPRSLQSVQVEALKILSRQVVKLLELRRTKNLLEERQKALELKNTELKQFAQIAAHDLKSPLHSIIMMNDLIKSHETPIKDPEILKYLDRIYFSAHKLSGVITGILEHSKSELLLAEKKSSIDLTLFMEDLIKLVDPMGSCLILFPDTHPLLETNKDALEQIFINLLYNAIKYNDKEEIRIRLDFLEDAKCYHFTLKDNGRGIKNESLPFIFEIFKIEGATDRFGKKGNGIGLATVKKLIEGLGGKIGVHSEVGVSTTFEFSLLK